MSNHNWVEITVTPLSAEVNEDGQVLFYTSEEALEIAQEDTQIICWDCKVEPDLEAFENECEGAPTQGELREK